RYVDAVEKLVVGDPRERQTQIGPKISAGELEKSMSALDAAVGQGARVLTGGKRLTHAGYEAGHWMAPTVITHVTDDMAVMQRETFGPVTPIASFNSWDEVVARSND